MANNRPNTSHKGMHHGHHKAKDVKGSLLKLIKFLKPFYLAICISLCLAIAGTLFNLIGPHITKKLSSVIVKHTFFGDKIPMEEITRFGLMLLILSNLE